MGAERQEKPEFPETVFERKRCCWGHSTLEQCVAAAECSSQAGSWESPLRDEREVNIVFY